jgi:hypothetical protein
MKTIMQAIFSGGPFDGTEATIKEPRATLEFPRPPKIPETLHHNSAQDFTTPTDLYDLIAINSKQVALYRWRKPGTKP